MDKCHAGADEMSSKSSIFMKTGAYTMRIRPHLRKHLAAEYNMQGLINDLLANYYGQPSKLPKYKFVNGKQVLIKYNV